MPLEQVLLVVFVLKALHVCTCSRDALAASVQLSSKSLLYCAACPIWHYVLRQHTAHMYTYRYTYMNMYI